LADLGPDLRAIFGPILGSGSLGTGIGTVGEDPEVWGIPKYWKGTDMLRESREPADA